MWTFPGGLIIAGSCLSVWQRERNLVGQTAGVVPASNNASPDMGAEQDQQAARLGGRGSPPRELGRFPQHDLGVQKNPLITRKFGVGIGMLAEFMQQQLDRQPADLVVVLRHRGDRRTGVA